MSGEPSQGLPTVPQIASRMRELAAERGVPELADLAEALRRRSPTDRVPQTSRPMTPELADEVRALRARHPDLSQAQIGARLNINQGRVSEVLKGFR